VPKVREDLMARNHVADVVVRPTMPIARLMRYTAFAVSALLLVSACADRGNGGTPASDAVTSVAAPSPAGEGDQAPLDVATSTQAGSGGGAVTQEEADEANRRSGSADVAVAVAGTVVAQPGPIGVTGTFTVKDKVLVVTPTIEIVFSDGIRFAELPAECELVEGAATCLLANFLQHPTNDVPDPFDFVLPLEVTAVSGEVTVTVTATSRDNPVDNDPDPSNNIAIHTIVVG